MRKIFYEVSPVFKNYTKLENVSLTDVFKVCLEAQVSEDETFRLVETMTDTDTAVALYSSNVEARKNAAGRVFPKVDKLIKRESIKIGFSTSFKVLEELYRMDEEGVPISKDIMFELAEEYLEKSKHSVQELKKEAAKEGIEVTEANIRSKSYSFPTKYTDLNLQLDKTRKDIKHANFLAPQKLRKYVFFDEAGNARLKTKWDIFGSVSGRIQSSSFNVQGLPKVVREKCLVPKEGYSLVFADYVSEELVLIAILTGDTQLLSDIMKGNDLHKKVASLIFSKDARDITKDERSLAKAVVFAYLYGAGDETLSNIIADTWSGEDISVGDVKDAIYYTFPKVTECKKAIEKQGYIQLINGQKIDLADIPKRHTIFNRMIQGSGSVILKEVIAELAENLPDSAKICFLLHDEVTVEVANNDADICIQIIKDVMGHILSKYGIGIKMPVSISVKKGGEK